MKFLKYILFIGLIAACSSPQSNEETATESPESTEVKQWLTLNSESDKGHIVFVSGDEEYRSEEALPQMAKILANHHGFKCTVLFAQDPEVPGIVDANYLHNIPGLEHLADADLMVMFTRFRALPDDQMKVIDDYLMKGGPVIGIRTATHAFRFNNADFESSFARYGNFYQSEDEWNDGFGRLVMGEKWISHHGRHGHQSTKGIIDSSAEGHPILTGIADGDVWGATDVYGVRLPLPGDSQPLILGQVVNRPGEIDEADPRLGMRPTDSGLPEPVEREDDEGNAFMHDQNDPMMPVAWTKSYQLPGGEQGKCFSTTVGASVDLLLEGTRRMFVNAAYWALDMEVPESADVSIVGSYEPTRFAFHDDEYWTERNIVIADLE